MGLGGWIGALLFAGSVLDLWQLIRPLCVSVSSSVKRDNTSHCALCYVDLRSKHEQAAPESTWPLGEQHCRWGEAGQLVDLQ